MAGTAPALSMRSSIVTSGQRSRRARTTRFSTVTTPAEPWVLPGRSTAVMS